MREILFRGKRVDNGEWVEWHFFETVEWIRRCCNIVVDKATKYYTDKKTVSQYTWLKDKNGEKIFDGDILATSNCDEHNWYDKWDKEDFGYTVVSFPYQQFLYSKWSPDEYSNNVYDLKFIEVIGNIHENPELLTNE